MAFRIRAMGATRACVCLYSELRGTRMAGPRAAGFTQVCSALASHTHFSNISLNVTSRPPPPTQALQGLAWRGLTLSLKSRRKMMRDRSGLEFLGCKVGLKGRAAVIRLVP